VAQNLGQRIGKSSWLRELQNISLSHGVSLLCWRSGGVEHLHDTPPYPSRRHQLSPIARARARTCNRDFSGLFLTGLIAGLRFMPCAQRSPTAIPADANQAQHRIKLGVGEAVAQLIGKAHTPCGTFLP